MVTSLIVIGLVSALAGNSVAGWLSLTGLVVVLAIKARLEERWMLAQNPQ